MFNISDYAYLFGIFQDVVNDIESRKLSRNYYRMVRDTTGADTSEEAETPKGKPRPPAGGKISKTHKPEIIPILVARLNSAVLSVRNS